MLKLWSIIIYGLAIIMLKLFSREIVIRWGFENERGIKSNSLGYKLIPIGFVIFIVICRVLDEGVFLPISFLLISLIILFFSMVSLYHLIKAISWYKKEELLNN